MRAAPVVLVRKDVEPARGRGRERAQALVDGRVAVAHLRGVPMLSYGLLRARGCCVVEVWSRVYGPPHHNPKAALGARLSLDT